MMQAPINPDLNYPGLLELGDFNEVILRDAANWVDLVLRESEEASLRISGPEEMTRRYRCIRRGNRLYISLGGDLFDRIIDAFTTSLTRKHVTIELGVVNLKRVKAIGMVEVDMTGLLTLQPDIQFFGPAALWQGRLPVIRP
jgi:hypothetical protein